MIEVNKIYKRVSLQTFQKELSELAHQERIWKMKDNKKYIQTLTGEWITTDKDKDALL